MKFRITATNKKKKVTVMDLENKIGVIGAGAWGTALALAFERADFDVLLWAYEQNVVDDINQKHENLTYLKGQKLPERIKASNDFADFKDFKALLLVCPGQHIGKITEELYSILQKTHY